MSEQIYCLVSRLSKPVVAVNGEIETSRPQIIACSFEDHSRKIALADGWSPHDAGGVTTPANLLAGDNYFIFHKNGDRRYERVAGGAWFEHHCDLLDCPWFPPFVRRMAAGEVVPLREIQDGYRAHSDGQDMPTGTWRQLCHAYEVMSRKS
jgi:hypothetical protein